eukprot:TRINITY_DN1312_c0_g1_i1.p1 TRINITY_DN1312_c0_g1~~TRINITY_DN1312_c0_g1_i1.p1  ORF type:complete len:1060 (+),score=303.41 TRINITY_DN1312_c0_g1_i1:90-3269(+)
MDDFLGAYKPAPVTTPVQPLQHLPPADPIDAPSQDERLAALRAAEAVMAAAEKRLPPPAAPSAVPPPKLAPGQTVVALRRIALVTGADVEPSARGVVLKPHGSTPGTVTVTFSGVSVDAAPGVDVDLWTPAADSGTAALTVQKCRHRRLAGECGECPRPDLSLRTDVRVAADATQTWFDGVVAAKREDGSVVVRVDGFGSAAWDRIVALTQAPAPKQYQYTPTPPPAPEPPKNPTEPCAHRRLRHECGNCPRGDVAVGDTVEVCDDGTSTWFTGTVERLGDYGEPVVLVPGFRRQPWDRLRLPGAAQPAPAQPHVPFLAGDKVRVSAGTAATFDGYVTPAGKVHVPGVGTGVAWDQVWRPESKAVENSYERFWRLREEEEQREKAKVEESAEDRRRKELQELEARRLRAELALACDSIETQEQRDRAEEDAEEHSERLLLYLFTRVGTAEGRELAGRREVVHDEEWERRLLEQTHVGEMQLASRREQRRLGEEARTRERGDEWARLEAERVRLEAETRQRKEEREAALRAAEEERRILREQRREQEQAEKLRIRAEQMKALEERRAALADDWTAVVDAQGRTYYYSAALGETRWDDPRAKKEEPAAPAPLVEGDDWVECPTDDGRSYFYSASRGVTTWDDPRVVEKLEPETAEAGEAGPGDTDAESAPAQRPVSASAQQSKLFIDDTDTDSMAAPMPRAAQAERSSRSLLFAGDTDSESFAAVPPPLPSGGRPAAAALFSDTEAESEAVAPARPSNDSSDSEPTGPPRKPAPKAARNVLADSSSESASDGDKPKAPPPATRGDSSSESDEPAKPAQKPAPKSSPAKATPPAAFEDSSSDSDAPAPKPVPKQTAAWLADSSSDSDIPAKPAKAAPKKAAAKKATGKKAAAADSSSESDTPVQKPQQKPAPKKPAAALADSSSSEDIPAPKAARKPQSKAAAVSRLADSSSDSSSDAPAPKKAAPKKAAPKKAAPKKSFADDSSSSGSDSPADPLAAAPKPKAKQAVAPKPSFFEDSSSDSSDAPPVKRPPAKKVAAPQGRQPPSTVRRGGFFDDSTDSSD